MALPDPINLSQPIGRTATAVTAEVDGQLVALDVTQGVCFGLNRVATRIWQLIEAPRPADAIVDILLHEYEVDRQTCTDQTADLLRDLVRVGLAGPAPAR